MKNVTVLKEASNLEPIEQTVAVAHAGRRSLRTFVRELKQGRVCRAAITYVLIMWLNLQIGDVIFPMLGIPAWTLKLIIMVGLMAFPLVLIVVCLLDQLRPGPDDRGEPPTPVSRGAVDRTLDVSLLVITMVACALMLGALSKQAPAAPSSATSEQHKEMATAQLNRTNEATYALST